MDEKTKRLTEQLKNDPAAIQNLMRSKDGQMLMQMLTQKDQGAGLRQAVQSAVQGNTTAMTQLVNQIMQSPGGAELVQRINQAVKK